MKTFTFSLVAVVLAEIRGFKLVVYDDYDLCLLARPDKSRSIARITSSRVVLRLFREEFVADMGRLHHKCNRLRLLTTCSITITNK